MAHWQYGPLGMFGIFLYGIVLGIMRWKTGSTSLVFLIHAQYNTMAFLAAAIQVNYLAA